MAGAGGHSFAVGQVVEFLPATGEPAAERSRCEVTRLLPRDEGEWRYYVRSASGGRHERRVREAQLRVLPTV